MSIVIGGAQNPQGALSAAEPFEQYLDKRNGAVQSQRQFTKPKGPCRSRLRTQRSLAKVRWFDTFGRVEHTGCMNVALTAALEDFVRRKVESGEFRSPDEVVFEGPRLLQQQDEQWKAEVRGKIDEGWDQAKAGKLRSPEATREDLAVRKEA